MPFAARDRPKARLLLVGGGPMEEKLRAQAAASPAADRIRFVGRVSHDEVERYYALIDILASSAQGDAAHRAGNAAKPLEAMAQRKLVVASNVGRPSRADRGWRHRHPVPGRRPAALAEALVACSDGAASGKASRQPARLFVERERNWSSNISRYAPSNQRLTGMTL